MTYDNMIEEYYTLVIDHWYATIPITIIVLFIVTRLVRSTPSSSSSSSSPSSSKDGSRSNKVNDSKEINKKTKKGGSSLTSVGSGISTTTTTLKQGNTTTTTTTTVSSPHIQPQQQLHQLFFKQFKTMTPKPWIYGVSMSSDNKLAFTGGQTGDNCIKIIPMSSIFDGAPKTTQANIKFDTADTVAWSSNGNLYATLHDSRKLIGWTLKTNAEGKQQYVTLFEADTGIPIGGPRVITLCASANYILVMTEDTMVRLYDSLKGTLLTAINTGQMKHYMASMSGNGKLFSIASFNSEIKIWEPSFKRDNSFDKAPKAISLTGYKTSIFGISFNNDGTRVITVSKDGLLKLWNLDINYGIGQEPEVIYTVAVGNDFVGAPANLVTMAPNGKVFAIGNQNFVQFRRVSDGQLLDTLPKAAEGTPYTDNSVCWTNDSKFFITSGYGVFTLWNVPKL
ncbi:WD40 repeat-containing protein [Cavenderia fasciculata]|uniref:WD40 repeat-containing protein n=1 Tax=Cavenderia fasciculata TaxID=261658 RepID=F4QFU6_CACFS|nr:WD40 repeat-containing protein [Cavenderia fasciculata]EGG14343.1 WD40 repeat-containing protein [Cavenderia fasciculata]|eukprot:XP_004351052.1 WD40 repeat-containing protein [Cavenderia fasciculata]